MSLIDLNDIGIEEEENGELEFSAINAFEAETKFILSRNRENVQNSFGEIKQGDVIAYFSAGRWSAHDLMFWLLSITGPANVYFTTWAINETAARLLARAKEKGLIKKLFFVFDRRIEVRNPDVMQLLKNIADKYVFIDCHAKNLVIENDTWMITNIGSANMSNNKRIESGTILTDRKTGEQFKNVIMDLINKKDVLQWK